MILNELKTGPWSLKDLENVKKINKTVFSCFHCGGGSTMGYKLAGYDVLGGVEIDLEMASIYKVNHNPKYQYVESIVDFNKRPDESLPKELFNLDILDGSPPCSSFSMAGSREKAWGDKKKFREGQAEQVLDDLFFHFVDTAKKLQPKVVIAENVKGLIAGKAKGYVKQIANKFNDAGYNVQLFLLNSAFMGVPQRRERTFFIARKKNLLLSKINLNFKEDIVPLSNVFTGSMIQGKQRFSSRRFADSRVSLTQPILTMTTLGRFFLNGNEQLNKETLIRCQSFPDDYNFHNLDYKYVCGMSVPPFMMQRIATEIYKQVLC